MATQHVTIELPALLYERFRRRAEESRRTVADEVLEVVAMAPVDDDLPTELEDAIASLVVLDDAALWSSARAHLPTGAAEELEALHYKRQREGLTDAEAQAAASLTNQYERTMLVRARAAALLRERGHDVSSILGAT